VIRRQVTQRLVRLAAIALWLVSATAVTADTLTLKDLQDSIDNARYDTAAQQTSHYLELHPGNRDARFLYALALAGQGKRADAIDAFKALAADYPQRVEPANNLAVLYARDQQLDKAREWLEKAMATQPAYATTHRNLGDIYTALADLAYRRALDADNITTSAPLTLLDRFHYAHESVATDDSAPSTPSADRDQPGPVPAASERRSVMQAVRAWAQAWARQDVEAYLNFYAEDFDPGDGLTRAQWRAMRKARLGEPDDIHIAIEDPTVRGVGDNRLRVEFMQKYRSPGYSDAVTKRLLMQRSNDGWRILRETSMTDS